MRAGGDTVVVGLGGTHHAAALSGDEFGLCMGWFESQGWFMHSRGGRYYLRDHRYVSSLIASLIEIDSRVRPDVVVNDVGFEHTV
jgi:hypothetical protein